LSPDGNTLAISKRFAINVGDEVELWNVRKGELRRTIEMEYGRSRPTLAFSPDGKKLAVAFGGLSSQPLTGGARLFDSETGRLLQTLADHKCTVVALAFSPDGNMLATGGQQDHEIHLWDVRKGERVRVLDAIQGVALALAFSPDGKTVACGDSSGGIRLHDIQTGKEKTALKENPGHCSLVTFSRDGRFLAGAGQVTKDGRRTWEVRLWEFESRDLLLALPNASDSVAFSPDDRTLSVLIPGKGVQLTRLAGK
jgi:WD40 repeat protein